MGASLADTDLDEDSDFSESHEINVTPFIDVILVLLIIFMVAAPLSTVDLPIDLPSSTATPQKKPDKPTYVSIKPDLAIAIGENLVKRADLVSSLDAMADSSKDRFIFLRDDRAVAYGALMEVLEILRTGGYSKIKLVALEGVPDSVAPPPPTSDTSQPQNLKP
jgi:biopolymer transport protein ExbD